MRRKRRNRYTWFPQLGTSYGIETQLDSTAFEVQDAIESGSVEGILSTPSAIPLLPDQDETGDSAAGSLRDKVEGKDYILKRVVGKTWGGLNQNPPDAPNLIVPQRIIFCLAFAVLPVKDDDFTPEGSTDDYGPLYSQNTNKPWMWRRTWVWYNNLGVDPSVLEATNPQYTGPTNILNTAAGVMDAGHIDIKVSRRVRKNERIFAIVQWQLLSTGGGDTTQVSYMHWGIDLRYLGAMRRAQNKSVLT